MNLPNGASFERTMPDVVAMKFGGANAMHDVATPIKSVAMAVVVCEYFILTGVKQDNGLGDDKVFVICTMYYYKENYLSCGIVTVL